ncbi:MAG TPA: hypothetical protein VMM36_02190 [Opitutaceae bacterium]|nr:hypothetical protein [Opitutaceae bacterium]
MSWFEKRLRELRRQSPDQRVWIFSDGTDEELKTLLAFPWVARAPERRDVLGSFTLSAIAQISGTKAMVVTGGSSFHRWGVFLGQVPVLAHAVDEWHAPIWSRLSPCGVAITGNQEPTAEDWARVLNGRKWEPAIR